MTLQSIARRVFACSVILGVAHVTSAAPLQNAAAQIAAVPALTRGWGHVDANPTVAIRAAMVSTDVTFVVVANTLLKDGAVICADTVLTCGYGSGAKKYALPWDFRRAGSGVAFTVLGANVAIRRDGFSVIKAMTF